jgi:hypothetical protein
MSGPRHVECNSILGCAGADEIGQSPKSALEMPWGYLGERLKGLPDRVYPTHFPDRISPVARQQSGPTGRIRFINKTAVP